MKLRVWDAAAKQGGWWTTLNGGCQLTILNNINRDME